MVDREQQLSGGEGGREEKVHRMDGGLHEHFKVTNENSGAIQRRENIGLNFSGS